LAEDVACIRQRRNAHTLVGRPEKVRAIGRLRDAKLDLKRDRTDWRFLAYLVA
jgi:hypothetical protein